MKLTPQVSSSQVADFSRIGIGGTLLTMSVVIFAMRLLEVMFFVGIAGSSIVVLITSFEDMHELFGKSEEAPAGEKTSQP